MQKISTLILTEDNSTLKLIKLHLSEFDNLEILEEQDDYKSIVYTLSQIDHPAIFIVDLSSKQKDKLDLITKISAQCHNCKIITISNKPTVDLVVQIMRTGAKDFVQAPLIKNDFVEAVNKTISLFEKPKKTTTCKVISVFSNKGGLGKTTIATNMALELAKMTGENVILLDMNFQMGDVTTFLNIKPSFNISYMLEHINKINETFLLSTLEKYKNSSLYILADPPYFKQAENITPKQISRLLNVLKESFSYIVIDAEASFEDKSISVLDNSDIVLLITIASQPVLKNTQRCLEFFDKLGYDKNKVRLVLNRYTQNDKFKIEDVVRILSKPIYRTIPNDYEGLMSALNEGMPASSKANSEVAESFKDLARDVSYNIDRQKMIKKFENILKNY